MLNYKLYLNVINEMVGRIEESLGDEKEFMRDAEIQDATLMRLQVIGENMRHIPIEIKKRNKQVKWQKFGRLRNLISHKYNSVDYEIVWKFIKENIPELKEGLKSLK